MTDPDTQPHEVGTVAKTRNHACETVVRVVPSTVLEPRHAHGEVNFVVGDQDFIRLDTVETR